MSDLSRRDAKVNWHPYTQMHTAGLPIPIVKGDGAWLIAEDGSRYLDAISSWWVNLHGHNHPFIMEKLRNQLQQLDHVIFSGFTHPPAVELSEALLEKLPPQHSRIFYSDNGSTAVEVGLKMAIQYFSNRKEKRQTFISLRGGYHGDTFGAMASGGRGIFSTPFENYLFNVIHIDVPTKGNEDKSLKQLEEAIGCGNALAFVFEPLLQGAAGMVMYDPEILDKLIQYCKNHDVLTIADEVSTGFGRTGKYFASDHLKQQPDIICMSKGLSGGVMALGATSTTEQLYEAFLSNEKSRMFLHGHSYTGNPLACTAALASLQLLNENSTWDAIDHICYSHQEFVEKIQSHPSVESARSLGVVLAVTVVSESGESYFNYLRDKLYNHFIARKILLRPLGNVIYMLPPYCINAQELKMVYNAIEELLDELKKQ